MNKSTTNASRFNSTEQIHHELLAAGVPIQAADRIAGMVYERESTQDRLVRALADVQREAERVADYARNGNVVRFEIGTLDSKLAHVSDLSNEQIQSLDALVQVIATVADLTGITRDTLRDIIYAAR